MLHLYIYIQCNSEILFVCINFIILNILLCSTVRFFMNLYYLYFKYYQLISLVLRKY